MSELPKDEWSDNNPHLVVRTGVIGRVLEDVRRAGVHAAMGEHLSLDARLSDEGERREVCSRDVGSVARVDGR